MSASGAVGATPGRRRERRVPVHLPMLIRGTDGTGEWFEEKTSSENLCRRGAAFSTRTALELGASVEISIPGSGSASDSEFLTQGRVVYRRPGKREREQIVGVEFTGPRFHRMFVSESTS